MNGTKIAKKDARRVIVDPDLHDKLAHRSIDERTSIQAIVHRILSRELREDKRSVRESVNAQ